MRKLLFIVVIFLLNGSSLFSQIAINNDGSAPDPSAGLDINFVNKGLLLPRMNLEQRDNIPNPAEGLMIYCTDCSADTTGALSIFQGGVWRVFNLTCTEPNKPSPGTLVPETNQITWNWNGVPVALGYKWNTANNFGSATDLGLATSFTETGLTCWTDYTRYVWAYNACGQSYELTLNQSTEEIPFSPAPVAGEHYSDENVIMWFWNPVTGATGYRWNTTDDFGTASDMGTATFTTESGLTCNTSYTRYVWAYNACGASTPTPLTKSTALDPPSAPVSSTHQPSLTQIVWKWNHVSGATGYKWGTVNNYASATEMGADTSKTETGLTCNTNYTRYVWAYSNCGVSGSTLISQATLSDPPSAPAPGTHVPSPTQIIWNWNAVSGATGYKWNTTNNYSTAIDMGTATFKTETGLTCNTSYTRYVWSYGNCGVSASTTLSQLTSLNPPAAPVSATHIPSPVQIVWNWNTVTGAMGYKWNTTNNYASAIDMGTATTKTETGLTCNTPYIRYVWAYSNCGVSSVTSLNQSTSLDPPASPVAATHVPSPTQIIWNWNTVPGAAGYKWNTSNNYGTALDMGTATTKTETGLTCSTSYSRYVWAYSNCGVSVVSMLTQTTSLDPPAAPVSATHIPSPLQIIWNWNMVTGASGYKWNTTNNYGTALDMGTLTTKTETGLSCNTSYTRYVWAYGNCGVSTVTCLIQSTTLDPCAPPVAASHVPSPTQIIWNWNTVSGATGYKWNITNDYATAMDMGTATTKTESGLTCNTSYTRFAWAYSNCGPSTATTLNQSTSLDPPAVPAAGTHVASQTQIIWNWNTVTGATGYKWNTANNYSTAIDMGTSTTKTETGLTCNTAYSRYVWAYSNCGNSSQATLTQSTTNDPPAAPVSATHDPSPTQIVWNWNTVSGATGYKWNTTSNYTTATDMGTVTTKTETGLTCNTSYSRYVWAYNICNHSISTTLTQATSLDPPATPASGTHVPSLTQIVWNWNAVAGATGYKWNTTNDFSTAIEMGTATSKTETGLTCNTQYTRFVWSYNNCGTSTASNLVQATSANSPAAPVAATHVPSSAQIVWNWNTVSGATGYKWNTTNNYSTAIEMGSSTTKTETGLTCNTAYTRYVWAYGACGVSTATTLTQSTTSDAPGAPVSGNHVASSSQIVWNWNTVAGATGYLWCPTNNYEDGIDVGTATTFTEMNLTCNTAYTRYIWAYNGCDESTGTTVTQSTTAEVPASPVAGTHVPGRTQIAWNWSSVNGASGYKWSAVNDYASATDMGNITTTTETNLSCGTSYTRYVWAYNSCGHSAVVPLTQSTSICWTCGESFTVNHVAGTIAPVSKSVTYGTVNNIPGETSKCWITSNLGADHQATSKSDATEASAGWYWQFNRMQGYKHDGTTRTPNTTWITVIDEYLNWDPLNDPCTIELGTGWRIPTITEWNNVDASGSWTNWNGPWNSALKIHAAGWLDPSNGLLSFRGSFGGYWSSSMTGNTTYGQALFFHSAGCGVNMYQKTTGYSIRCIHNN